MKNIIDMFDEEWERQAIEAEIECGGIVTGRLGSPDDHPMEPVTEDEATLREFLAEKFKRMLQSKNSSRKTARLPTPFFREVSCWTIPIVSRDKNSNDSINNIISTRITQMLKIHADEK